MNPLHRHLLLTLIRRRERVRAMAMGALRDPVTLSRLELHRWAARGFRNRPGLSEAHAPDHIRTLLAIGDREGALAAAQRAKPSADSRLALAAALIDPVLALPLYRGGDQSLRAGLLAAVGREQEAMDLAAATGGFEGSLVLANLRRDAADRAGPDWAQAFGQHDMSPPVAADPGRPVSVTNATAEIRVAPSADDFVSVVMPARNAERWVGAAVRSVLAQGWRNLELIFVNDASTDDTAAVALAAANGDARFRLLTHDERRGAYGARNTALASAKGRWIAFQDADEWAHPDRLALQINAMRESDAVASTGRGIRVDADGVLRARGVYPLSRWAPSTLVIEREPVLAKAGVFDEVLSGADNEYWWRLNALFSPRRCAMLRRPLILGASRADSLTGAADSGFGSKGYNLDRLRYWEAWSLWHLRNVGVPEGLHLVGGERPFRISETMRV